MAGFTDTYEQKVLNHFLRNTAQTPDASLFVALYTTTPNDAGSGGVEVSAGDYSRKAVTFSAPVAGAVSNSALITFVASAATAWGTIVGVGITNAASGGVIVATGTVSPALVVAVGSPVNIPAGQLVFTLTD